MFLSLIQGLGFQFAIARLPIELVPEAERFLAICLQAIRYPQTRENALVPQWKRPRPDPGAEGLLNPFSRRDPSAVRSDWHAHCVGEEDENKPATKACRAVSGYERC